MKLTRASSADAEKLLELLQNVSGLLKKIEAMSSRYKNYEQDDCPEIFAVIEAANPILPMPFAGMTTAVLNLMAVLDPDNEIVDLGSSTLKLNPKFDEAAADTARLDFLISKGEAAFEQNEVSDWAVFDPHSHSQLVDAKWSGFGNSPRAAIDAAMQQSD